MSVVRFVLTFLTILISSKVVLMLPMVPGRMEIATDSGVRIEQVDEANHKGRFGGREQGSFWP